MVQSMNCEIINVGTELLTGAILNTNSQFLSSELSNIGINVHNISVVGDNPKRLQLVLENALNNNDIIILTGGLGPTGDDLTKEVVSKVFGKKLVLDNTEKEHLQNWFNKRNIPFTKNNLKQAYLPEDSIKIENPNGTAPGVYLHEDGKYIFLLPGPPGELKELYFNFVQPTLKSFNNQKVESRFYNITGLGESLVEDKLKDLVENQKNPTIATYANLGEILVRLTANGPDAEKLLDEKEKIIKERLGKYIFSYSNNSLVNTIGNCLIERNLTLSSAESCTGGMIGEQLTAIPGISQAYLLGLITYSNEAKIKVLNVNKKTLEKYGAVSEETCWEMCTNVRKILGTDFGIATTGIAGPDGGTPEKPVGLVYTGLATKDTVKIKRNLFYGNRDTVRKRTCNVIFQMLREELF